MVWNPSLPKEPRDLCSGLSEALSSCSSLPSAGTSGFTQLSQWNCLTLDLSPTQGVIFLKNSLCQALQSMSYL